MWGLSPPQTSADQDPSRLLALLAGVDAQKLCAALLETTANVLKEHYGPRQISDVFLLFCDRMECMWYGERAVALKYGRHH